MRMGISTRQPWECGRPRGLQHWGWVGCTPAHLFAQQRAAMQSWTRKAPELGIWVGARRLGGCRLGPITCGLPRRGGALGTPGGHLGARATPVSVRRVSTHCELHYTVEPAGVEFSHHFVARQPSLARDTHPMPLRDASWTSVFAVLPMSQLIWFASLEGQPTLVRSRRRRAEEA